MKSNFWGISQNRLVRKHNDNDQGNTNNRQDNTNDRNGNHGGSNVGGNYAQRENRRDSNVVRINDGKRRPSNAFSAIVKSNRATKLQKND